MNELLKTFLGNIVNEGGIEEVKDEKVLNLEADLRDCEQERREHESGK